MSENGMNKGRKKRRLGMDNVTATFKKGKKKDLGNCGPGSPTLVPGKVMEQITLETVSTHMMEKKMFRRMFSQRGKHS